MSRPQQIIIRWISILAMASLFLGACVQGSSSTPAGNPTTAASAVPAASQPPVTLKLALIPVLDALPIYVAQKEGFFQAHGVNVEFVPVRSAPERDQLIAAGQADGMVNEAVSTIFYNKDKVQVQIVRYARTATTDSPLFRIMAAKDSGINSAADLKGVEVGISQGTVIEYLNDRLLQAEGFQPADIKSVAVPSISDRMSLLASGKLKAAILPDPFVTMAQKQGATIVLDDSRHPEYSFSTISFRKTVIDQNPEAIRAFLAAIEDATNKINANPQQYGSLLVEQKVVPPDVVTSFTIPKFVTAGVPTEAQWADALKWTQEKGLVKANVPYKDSVNPTFLPGK